ncbi:hypothetical protein VB779_22475 [Haloarculaceae archaeon H-GB11]|nr:hypothetical protein [Haloarculaceae archaeon H-GB11]
MEIQSHSDVRYVEEDTRLKLLGTRRPSVKVESETTPWGIDRIGAAALQNQGETGAGAHIAILDSGIDSNHPDLQANLGEGRPSYPVTPVAPAGTTTTTTERTSPASREPSRTSRVSSA